MAGFQFNSSKLQILSFLPALWNTDFFFDDIFSTGSTDFSPGFVSRVRNILHDKRAWNLFQNSSGSCRTQFPLMLSSCNMSHSSRLWLPQCPATTVHSIQHHPKTIRFPETFFRQFYSRVSLMRHLPWIHFASTLEWAEFPGKFQTAYFPASSVSAARQKLWFRTMNLLSSTKTWMISLGEVSR